MPFLASSALLVVAGVPKLRDPLPLVRALRGTGMPASRLLVRGVAAAEVVIGGLAIILPGSLSAALVCAAYLLFTAFVVLALHRGGVLGSCGCFGRADTVPTTAHAVLTGAAAVVAGITAWQPAVALWTGMPMGELALLWACVGLVGFLAWQVMAVLPTTTPAAIRSMRRDAQT